MKSEYIDATAYTRASIAKALRKLRLEAGLTQAEVARRAGIRPETLSRLEHGRGNPTVGTVASILRAARSRIQKGGRGRSRVR